MNKQEYLYGTMIGMLEDKLPPDLLNEVMKYLKYDAVETANKIPQYMIIYHHLLEKGEITTLACEALYGIRHPQKAVMILKEYLAGKKIPYYIDGMQWVTGFDRRGRECEYKKYRLLPLVEEGQLKFCVA